ncbi:MAG: peptidoglycan editing factor PgeF [Bryobacteraceae bacterium]
MFHLGRDNVYRSSVLQSIPWIDHGFGTRLESEWPLRDRLTSVRQVHSDQVVVANGHPGLIGEGDALITNQGGTLVSVRTADCFPILIADLRNRAVAAVHAGWRGTVAGIAVKAVQALATQLGSRREDLRIVIGPGIGPCCFEVGPEVAVQFKTLFPERADLLISAKLDLAQANLRQLVADGISPSQIGTAGLCTCCAEEVFHSYRRDGEQAGRMISAVGMAG